MATPITAKFGYVLVGVWSVLGAIATVYVPPSQVLELVTQSGFLAVRGTVQPPPEIVILAIDEPSLSEGRLFYDPKTRPFLKPVRSFPWQRTAYAEVIDRVMAAGAKVVALDLLLVTKSSYGVDDDARLQQSLDRYGDRVVLAASFETTNTNEANITQLVTPQEVFNIAPSAVGFVNFKLEANGNIHKLADQDFNQDKQIKSFDQVVLDAAKIKYIQTKDTNIYFFGGQNTWAQQQISFTYVLDPTNWQKPLLNHGQYFKDKIVLIGATATSLQDIQPTAFGRMSGVEVHANAIATLMTNRAIISMPHNIFLFLIVAVMGWGLILIRRPLGQFFSGLVMAIAWMGAGYISFLLGIIIPTAIPVITISLMGLSLLATGAIAAQVEKKRLESEKVALEIEKAFIRRTFERYVASPVVDEIIHQMEGMRSLLQGRTLQAAVLFADIRNFTQISAQLPPHKLISQLNTYLTAMVEAILGAQGTVDKFIGDAVMAEFGSPISYGTTTDAMNAIHAALKMRSRLHELRHQWRSAGETPLFNGIGINFGEVIVGNIGSPERLEYAVMGDTVNIASRVEGLTKSLQADILITESLYAIVKDQVEVIDLGEQEIRGRDRPLRLYSLIGLKGHDQTIYTTARAELMEYLNPK